MPAAIADLMILHYLCLRYAATDTLRPTTTDTFADRGALHRSRHSNGLPWLPATDTMAFGSTRRHLGSRYMHYPLRTAGREDVRRQRPALVILFAGACCRLHYRGVPCSQELGHDRLAL